MPFASFSHLSLPLVFVQEEEVVVWDSFSIKGDHKSTASQIKYHFIVAELWVAVIFPTHSNPPLPAPQVCNKTANYDVSHFPIRRRRPHTQILQDIRLFNGMMYPWISWIGRGKQDIIQIRSGYDDE